MLDDFITESKIEERHVKTDNDPDAPELDVDNVHLNIGRQSYRKQSTTDDSDNLTNNCDQEITKAREIL